MGNAAADYKLGKLNGRRVVTWQEDGRRRRFRLREGISAVEAASEFKAFVRSRERLLVSDDVRVGDIVEAYIRDREVDGKATSKQRYSWKALSPMFARMRPADITKADCTGFTNARLAEGCSAGTAWTDLGVLNAALGWAKKHKKISDRPHIFLPEQPPPKERFLTRAEAQMLLAAAATHHLRLFIMLALATAGRAAALMELTWDRVDFERGIIDLRSAERATNKRRAIIPMNESLRAELQQAKQGAISPFVIEWAGQRIRSVKTGFGRAVAKCGWDDVSPHTLRHTAAVWMAEADIPMAVIAQYLGHTSTAVTERVYARYSPSYLRKASDVLEIGWK
jgi:integrase